MKDNIIKIKMDGQPRFSEHAMQALFYQMFYELCQRGLEEQNQPWELRVDDVVIYSLSDGGV